jgi:aryl-alcohol dehydrogenase-like predicted oxidoreductase
MSFGDTSRGFNEWALGDEEAEPVFRQAVELGITFWDTANVYGFGEQAQQLEKPYTLRMPTGF